MDKVKKGSKSDPKHERKRAKRRKSLRLIDLAKKIAARKRNKKWIKK